MALLLVACQPPAERYLEELPSTGSEFLHGTTGVTNTSERQRAAIAGYAGASWQGCNLVVLTTDTSAENQRRVQAFYAGSEQSGCARSSVVLRPVRFTYEQLHRWAHAVVFGTKIPTAAGISGVENRIRIGVPDSASARQIALRLAQQGVPPEAVRLAITEPEGRALAMQMAAPYATACINAPCNLELTVGLIPIGGLSVSGIAVELLRGYECIRVEKTNDSGSIVFDSLPPGEYLVTVRTPEGVASGLLPLPSRYHRSTLRLTGNTPEETTFRFMLTRLDGWPAAYPMPACAKPLQGQH